jgi:hypothetical protein
MHHNTVPVLVPLNGEPSLRLGHQLCCTKDAGYGSCTKVNIIALGPPGRGVRCKCVSIASCSKVNEPRGATIHTDQEEEEE